MTDFHVSEHYWNVLNRTDLVKEIILLGIAVGIKKDEKRFLRYPKSIISLEELGEIEVFRLMSLKNERLRTDIIVSLEEFADAGLRYILDENRDEKRLGLSEILGKLEREEII